MRHLAIWTILLLTGMLSGCTAAGSRPVAGPGTPASASVSGVRFQDVAEESGIRFELGHQGRSPLTILETAGGGAAFLDYNNDGRLDALLVGPHRVGLFRNINGQRFAEATSESGLKSNGYWMGCAVADYDGDGWDDVLLTGYDRTALYRNERGRFRDATREAGLEGGGWSLSGAFGDYDGDGRVDLYVARYLHFNKSTPQLCDLGNVKTACGPEIYDPQFGILYRNVGQGRFQDVTQQMGVRGSGKTWAALFSDFNGDGFPELYLANDMVPCDFFLNERGRFRTAGAHANVSYDANGHLMGAMGVDSGDYDRDGRLDLLVTTYFAQPLSLYRNDEGGFFTESGTPAGLGMPTSRYVNFGAGFLDADNDGWLDVFLTNGHVRDSVKQHDPFQDYAQPLQFFRNVSGRFTEESASAGEPFQRSLVGRGAAFGDYDADGQTDVLVCDLEGKAVLLRNATQTSNHWLRVGLKGPGANTRGLGARVTVVAGGVSQIREVRTCGSVMSANEPAAHFGLGKAKTVERLVVRWPDGRESVRVDVPADQVIEVPVQAP